MGLLIVWGGTALLISPAAGSRSASISVTAGCIGQLALWMLFAAVLLIVCLWEKQPVSSLWLKPFRWQTLAWSAALVLAIIFLLFPVAEFVRNALRLPGYASGMEKIAAFPIWFRIFAAATAGIVEETLFRGYSITRLTNLTGSLWLAAMLSTIAFAALHFPVWGIGPCCSILISGGAITAFFIWQRDLLVMILSHFFIDAWALVIVPLYFEWWK